MSGTQDIMALWLSITLLILNLANSILHGTGIYLLISLFPRSRFKIQQRYLIHLSVSEFIFNMAELTKIVFGFVPWNSKKTQLKLDKAFHYLLIVQFTGVALVFYLVMIYLTLDRLMEIVLNIKYPIYWSEEKARLMLIITWIVAGFIAAAICLAHGLVHFNWEPYIYMYFFPVMGFVFLILAITTYTFIFKKYKVSRIHPGPASVVVKRDTNTALKHSSTTSPKRHRSSIYIFRRSKFFIPVLLISTFLIFMVGADLTLLFATVVHKNKVSEELTSFVFISYAISNLCDACINIFLQKDVRRLLYKKLHISTTTVNTFNNTNNDNNNNTDLNTIADNVDNHSIRLGQQSF